MACYMVELPDGTTVPMDDEALEAYHNGTWDPTQRAELTEEDRQATRDLVARLFGEKPQTNQANKNNTKK